MADPQTRWGTAVLDRLPLRGDERVLDAGCGTGRVTELVAERLPDGHVVALDQSAGMLAEARRRLARFGDHVTYVYADLARPLPGTVGRVNAVLSTATFHWVLDHDALFRNLAAVMAPGALLVAQCGGHGNVEAFEHAAHAAGLEPRGGYTFATAEETAARVRAAGFTDIRTWLSPEPTPFESAEQLEVFLETVCMRTMLERLPPADRPRAVREVANRIPDRTLDYVRLNIVARRAGASGRAAPAAAMEPKGDPPRA